MITYLDEKKTAKQAAEELLADSVAVVRGYWTENTSINWADMTERERAQVEEQLEKVGDRVARLLHFPGGSWVG